MALMKEAMTKEDFDRSEKGLPPLKAVKVARPEPEEPEIDNWIKFKDVDVKLFASLDSAKRRTIKNREGVRFIGFDVSMQIYQPGAFGRPKEVEKGVPAKPETITGWMLEGDFLQLRRTFSKKINVDVISW